jgi:hypothetical protein
MRLGLIILLATATLAHGHSGPPMTTDVRFAKTSPKKILAASSIGLLLSEDAGCTVRVICESTVGYGTTLQPKVAFAADEAILATTFHGLRVSRDGGCSFDFAAGIEDIWVDALDVGPTGEIWIGTSEVGRTNDILVSLDNGKTFAPRGLASTQLVYHSVKVAPGDPTRVYVAGDGVTSSTLYRRDGETWQALPATGVVLAAVPKLEIAAVDPVDRDTLYVISRATYDDHLYRSSDGGTTFVEVLAPRANIHDVVIHGGAVYVTTLLKYDNPNVNFDVGDIPYVSNDNGKQFAPLAGAPNLACLGIAPDGTPIGCAWNWEPDFKALALFDGTNWSKLWRFVEIAGPVACTNHACEAEWTQLQIDLMPTGPSCGSHAPSDAGMKEPPPAGAGCCSASGDPLGWIWAVAFALLYRRRRAQSAGP